MDKFKIVAKTLAGLEELLAAEVESIGGVGIAIGTRMVSYIGDKELLYKSNLWLRLALRILKPIATFEAADPDALYEAVKAIDWDQYIAKGQTIAIDTTVNSDTFRHSRYALYRAKDAICDYFTTRGDDRPKVSLATADVVINLHIAGTECTVSLDSSGTPLYKRGYKHDTVEAPINEVLAAGILLKAGWDGSRDLVDPMCGSGTFLIEAAMIATGTPAGIYRESFGFERWTVGELAYDAELWQRLYDDDSGQRDFKHHIYGSDISRPAIEKTEANVRAAGLAKYITLEVKDFETYDKAPAEGCLMVCNPPYGRRLITDVPTFYQMMGHVLKTAFTGCEAWIISLEGKATYKDPRSGAPIEAEPLDFIGLKPSVREVLNNGGLDCQLRKYEMFAGRFNDFRADGKALDKKRAEEKTDGTKFTRLHRDTKKGDRKPARAAAHGGRDDSRRPDRRQNTDWQPSRQRDRQDTGWQKADRQRDRQYDRRPTAEGEQRPRGFRKFDPNRPFFGRDFDPSQHVLDMTDYKE